MKKSRRILWAGRVARVEETEMRAGFWWEKVKENPLWRAARRREDNIKMGI